MRKSDILQFLKVMFPRLGSRHQSGMAVYILSAPSAKILKEVCEHLRYWPYVKAFKPVDDTHMKVLVFIGKGFSDVKWNYYTVYSCKLMNQCVRQYQALFEITNYSTTLFLRLYNRNGFMRPDYLLNPLYKFIDELYQKQ